MGSEVFVTLKSQGRKLSRGGAETIVGAPEEFTIIGSDISAEKLSALYPDESKAHERARAIIRGVVDRTRTKGPPPDWFVASLSGGVTQFPTVANLGPDRKGRIWFPMVIGRQRNGGLREWNRRNPGNAHELTCVIAPLKHNDKAGIDAELDALEANAESNVFVAMPDSGKADHAARLKSKGKADADIAGRIGARDAEHVKQLLALAECCEKVQAEVDAGHVLLADALVLCKLTPEEQARRVARKQAGNGKAAKDASAPPRAKTKPAAVLASWEATVRASVEGLPPRDAESPVIIRRLGFIEGLIAAQGKGIPEWAAKFVEVEEAARKGRASGKMDRVKAHGGTA